MISSKFLNKDYVEPVLITERMYAKHFHKKMENIDNKLKRRSSKTSITSQIKNAFQISSRIPANLHFFVDWNEKVKNIIQWK